MVLTFSFATSALAATSHLPNPGAIVSMTTSSPVPRIKIESPIANQIVDGTFLVQGWFQDFSGVRSVDVLVDGVFSGSATTGDPRSQGRLGNWESQGGSGFHYTLDTSALSAGNHIITVQGRGANDHLTSANCYVEVQEATNPMGQLQFSEATYNVSEADSTATITVSRVNGTTGTTEVNYFTSDGTALEGWDYSRVAGTLFFGVGEVTKTFTVPIMNDTYWESAETVYLTLSYPTGGATLGTPSQATLTIADLPSGFIKGLVKDAATNDSISDATVSVSYNNETVQTTTTSTDGSYSLEVPSRTDYQVSFTKMNYVPQTLGNVSVSGSTNYLETILLVPNSTIVGGATGTIKNALTGYGVGGLTLNLRSGQNTTMGTILKTTTTDGNGMYSVSNLTAGTYTGEIIGSGFQTTFFTVVVVGDITKGEQDATITPVLDSGETRIVLTWGATPNDLDSHLTGPTATGSRFHMYYSYKAFADSVSNVKLDVDDTSSYGPETTTISLQGSGVYRFSVHNYTNRYETTGSLNLAASGAKVAVYRADSEVATFNVPTDRDGTLWTVFEIDGSTINPINTMSYSTAPNYAPGRVASGHSDSSVFKNLPNK